MLYINKNNMSKEELLKQLWQDFDTKEIIKSAIENKLCTEEDIISSIAEFNENNSENRYMYMMGLIHDVFEKFCKTEKLRIHRQLPWCDRFMDHVQNLYSDFQIFDCFDNDDLIEHLEGSWEMNRHEEKIIKDALDSNDIQSLDDYKKMYIEELQYMNKYDFRRYLCDLMDLGYYCSDEELFTKLKDNCKNYC